MTDLLLKIFVPDHRSTGDPAVRAKIGSLSGTVGILCNFLLFAVKLLAGILTGSVSVTADAMNNLSDASGSLVTLLGFRLAGKPADDHHPYGHARYEYLTGLAVAVMILFIGFELGKTSVGKILNPGVVEFTPLAVGILLTSIAVKLWLSLFNRRLGTAIGSTALLAASADSRNDCVATTAVLAAGMIEGFTDIRADGFMGLAVALFILHSGLTLAKDTVSPLLGENADPELRRHIAAFISAQPKVLGYHDLMVHDYGPGQRFATLHVEMDHREDPLVCHELIDRMERNCLRLYNVHLVIHYDPVVTEDAELARLKELTAACLRERDSRLTFHDFRMFRGRRHMNLVMDISLPTQLQGQEEAITALVEDTLNAAGPETYHAVITYDQAAFEM